MNICVSRILAATFLVFGSFVAAPASAATQTYNVGWTDDGTNYFGSFTIDFDPAVQVLNTDNGLTINSLNFPVASPVQYSYITISNPDILRIGGSFGGPGGIPFSPTATNFDFAITINDPVGTPSLFAVSSNDGNGSRNGGNLSLSVGPPPQVPLPATALFLLSGIVALWTRQRIGRSRSGVLA